MNFGNANPQDIMDALCRVTKDERTRYHVTLGKLIEVLEQVPEEIPVRFVGGGSPDRIDSYRGYYSDLAISVQYEREVSVKVFLSALRTALNTHFEGYKGGQYLMDADTPLWCSEWGEASNKAIIDVSVTDDHVALWLKEIN